MDPTFSLLWSSQYLFALRASYPTLLRTSFTIPTKTMCPPYRYRWFLSHRILFSWVAVAYRPELGDATHDGHLLDPLDTMAMFSIHQLLYRRRESHADIRALHEHFYVFKHCSDIAAGRRANQTISFPATTQPSRSTHTVYQGWTTVTGQSEAILVLKERQISEAHSINRFAYSSMQSYMLVACRMAAKRCLVRWVE